MDDASLPAEPDAAGARIAEAVYLVALILGVLINEQDRGSFAVVDIVGALALAVVAVSWLERVTMRTGLDESPDGYVDRGNFGSRPIARKDVDHFEWVGGGLSKRVLLVRKDGGRIVLKGVLQHRRVVWADGETRDVVAVLNEQLRHLAEAAQPTHALRGDR